MNLAAEAPEWLAWLLVALLVGGAIEDAVRLRISNLTCAAILGAAIIAAFLAGLDFDLWQNLAVFTGLLAIGTPLFATGKMGGGDVKLMAVTGIWFNLQGALLMLVSVLLCGGVLALLLIALRTARWSDSARTRAKVLRRGGGIPYGVAISAGAIFAVSLARGWG